MTSDSEKVWYKQSAFPNLQVARWAVFFDSLEIAWEYQPKTFSLEWGSEKLPFTPDFYLPSPKPPRWLHLSTTEADLHKAGLLALKMWGKQKIERKAEVYICKGNPWPAECTFISFNSILPEHNSLASKALWYVEQAIQREDWFVLTHLLTYDPNIYWEYVKEKARIAGCEAWQLKGGATLPYKKQEHCGQTLGLCSRCGQIVFAGFCPSPMSVLCATGVYELDDHHPRLKTAFQKAQNACFEQGSTPWRKNQILTITDGDSFEEYITQILQADPDWQAAKRVGGRGDRGADIVGFYRGKLYVVQCKRHQGNVGPDAILKMVGAKELRKAEGALLVTTSFFSNNARLTAQELGIELWDMQEVVQRSLAFNVHL
jgi:hypothetical protein